MHDIGKNIVGVVLGCNNYEVIDLGVMVPARRSSTRAREKKVDIIGLSGLITPSLDEMVHVAQRNGTRGLRHAAADRWRHHQRACTPPSRSARTTAQPAIYVTDASRAVGVVSELLSPEERPKAIAKVREEYRNMADPTRAARPRRRALSIAEARANKLKVDWTGYTPPKPSLSRYAQLRELPISPSSPAISTGRRSSTPGS